MADCCRAGRVAAPDPCPWHGAGPDPRVKHGEGPHPDGDAVRALAESVHARLDALGVPRTVEIGVIDEELTLLGRMDAMLDKLGVQEGQEWTWFGEKWT